MSCVSKLVFSLLAAAMAFVPVAAQGDQSYLISRALISDKKWSEVIDFLDSLPLTGKARFELHLYRAIAAKQLGRPDESAASMARVKSNLDDTVDRDPGNWIPLITRAEYHLGIGQFRGKTKVN